MPLDSERTCPLQSWVFFFVLERHRHTEGYFSLLVSSFYHWEAVRGNRTKWTERHDMLTRSKISFYISVPKVKHRYYNLNTEKKKQLIAPRLGRRCLFVSSKMRIFIKHDSYCGEVACIVGPTIHSSPTGFAGVTKMSCYFACKWWQLWEFSQPQEVPVRECKHGFL